MIEGFDYAQRNRYNNFIEDVRISQSTRIIFVNQTIYDDLNLEYAGPTLKVGNAFTTVKMEPMRGGVAILILDNDSMSFTELPH